MHTRTSIRKGKRAIDLPNTIVYFCIMPTVFEIYGFSFFFYSNEGNEPIHIHISKDKSEAKYWLKPEISEEYSYGFKVKERKAIKKLILERRAEIIKKWYEYFE